MNSYNLLKAGEFYIKLLIDKKSDLEEKQKKIIDTIKEFKQYVDIDRLNVNLYKIKLFMCNYDENKLNLQEKLNNLKKEMHDKYPEQYEYDYNFANNFSHTQRYVEHIEEYKNSDFAGYRQLELKKKELENKISSFSEKKKHNVIKIRKFQTRIKKYNFVLNKLEPILISVEKKLAAINKKLEAFKSD